MNKKLIALAVLAFGVAITSFSVSGTYARYASVAEGTDTARVAKWQVEKSLTVDLFKESYLASDGTSTMADGSKGTMHKIVAPGTRGSYTFKIEDSKITTETNYKLIPELTFEQTTKNNAQTYSTYQPIKFYLFKGTVTDENLKEASWTTFKAGETKVDGAEGVDISTIQSKLQTEIGTKVYGPDATPESDVYSIVWEWELGTDVTSASQIKDVESADNNTKDTVMGNSAATSEDNEKFTFTVKVSVVQTNEKATGA